MTGRLVVLAIELVLIAFLAAIILLREIRQFPTEVLIEDTGFAMKFSLGKAISVRWSDISDMYLKAPRGREGRYGSFRIKGSSTPYHVVRGIALNIEDGYREAMGLPIPRWDGKRSSKVAPKAK